VKSALSIHGDLMQQWHNDSCVTTGLLLITMKSKKGTETDQE